MPALKFFDAISTASPPIIPNLVPLRVIYFDEIQDRNANDKSTDPIDYDKFGHILQTTPENVEIVADVEWMEEYPRFWRYSYGAGTASGADMLRNRITVQNMTDIAATMRSTGIGLYNMPIVPGGYSLIGSWGHNPTAWNATQAFMDRLQFSTDLTSLHADAYPARTDPIAAVPSMLADIQQMKTLRAGRPNPPPIRIWLDVQGTTPALLARLIAEASKLLADGDGFVLWLPLVQQTDGTWVKPAFNPAWPWVAVVAAAMAPAAPGEPGANP